ncbi:MAG: ABC transporter ATP-binding protein [Maledivibacter sp.]|jgi:ABC-type glutathione transport system ATPase component|nr:ABC transporter ATP-binding protein [Maledivibacter sp.]
MLEIVDINIGTRRKKILLDFSIALEKGKIIGLTGRSGAGKTTIIKAVMGFLSKECKISSGNIYIDGKNLIELEKKDHRNLCGTTIGYIPQSPMTSFDPRLKIGAQMEETFRVKLKLSKKEAVNLTIETLEAVNLADTKRIINAVPSELSGGMLQRVAMAILIGMKPKYIFADEPTSSLDPENRQLMLELLLRHCSDAGILFVSHDVEALKNICTTVAVLDEGHIVEVDTMENLLSKPREEWTKGFSSCYKNMGEEELCWMELG